MAINLSVHLNNSNHKWNFLLICKKSLDNYKLILHFEILSKFQWSTGLTSLLLHQSYRTFLLACVIWFKGHNLRKSCFICIHFCACSFATVSFATTNFFLSLHFCKATNFLFVLKKKWFSTNISSLTKWPNRNWKLKGS